MRINIENIIREFTYKAKSVLSDKERINGILQKAKEMIKNNKELNEIVDDVKVFIDLVRDYINGSYRQIPTSSIVLVTVGLIYLVTPIDVLPDFGIGGFIDDAAVIAYVLKKVTAEIEAYKQWKENGEPYTYRESFNSDKADDSNNDNLIEISLDDDDVEEI